jgi:hypothetical protein
MQWDMAKTVPESKFTELQGLDRISPTVHAMRCLWREITKSDFGIDGEIEVLAPREDGKGYQVTGGVIKVQAKAGSSHITYDTPLSFEAKSSRDDFELYYGANFPTLFIIFHPGEDKLYYKEMRSYLRNAPDVWQAPFKIVFDKQNDVFDKKVLKQLEEFAETSPPRVSHQEREQLFSNLFHIRELPRFVWSAPCRYSDRSEIFNQLPSSKFAPPFIITGKRMYSLSDLTKSRNVFRKFIDVDKILLEPAEAFWDDEDRLNHYLTLLKQLLGNHLQSVGIHYNADFKRSYFPRENKNSTVFTRSWYNLRTQRRSDRMVAAYYEYGFNKFWRHLAAQFWFLHIGTNWYLQINPMYLFTDDGKTPWDSEKVGSYTTRLKARQTNQHMLNHVLFWANTLAGLDSRSSVIKIWLNPWDTRKKKPHMTIEAIPTIGIANFAIPSDPAVYDEPEQPIQTSLFASISQLDLEDFSDKDEEELNDED